ncbi:transcriptional regulator with XRE-family HTH domain [Catenuloplanes nepalensis]|uniref:Transcriptional regulator with XRE-family HTH domain n=1 Tax=Catenuloplanes nepalensis TaxID=587533 RepID=A0ABT9MMC5_9ACTN|nr:Scr1 family TA system antitoxin-like transcriptional regulator [Catenuloplanes nepalensis]MDP9792553.1 transcriptional regulator with XRE-family HTH domain [Catenuloplanes nepalensis]
MTRQPFRIASSLSTRHSPFARWSLGKLLHLARTAAGMSAKEAAQRTYFTASHLLAIEAGEISVHPKNMGDLCDAYKIQGGLRSLALRLAAESRRSEWWQQYGVVPAWHALSVSMENAACRIRLYTSALVPDLLQTHEYALAVCHLQPGLTSTEIQQHLTVRMRRQELLQRPAPLALDVVVDEAVLHRQIAGPDAHHRQLLHLRDATQREATTIRVIPFSAGAHRPLAHAGFAIFDFAPADTTWSAPTTVYREDLAGATYLHQPADVELHGTLWRELGTHALDPHASAALITALATSSEPPPATTSITDGSTPSIAISPAPPAPLPPRPA